MITLLLHLLRLLPFPAAAIASSPSRTWPCATSSPCTGGQRPGPSFARRIARFWVGLARVWTGGWQSLVIVTPATVLRWQRRRFREHWTQLSGRPTGGRPPVNTEITVFK